MRCCALPACQRGASTSWNFVELGRHRAHLVVLVLLGVVVGVVRRREPAVGSDLPHAATATATNAIDEHEALMRRAFARSGLQSAACTVVVRHAIAEDADAGQDDADARAHPDGERKMRARRARAARARLRLDRVLTSPWLRAAQTAELLAPLGDGAPIATELLASRRAPSCSR